MSTIVQTQTTLELEPHFSDSKLQERKDFTVIQELEVTSPTTPRNETCYITSSAAHDADQDQRRDSGIALGFTQTALLVAEDRTYKLVQGFPAPQELAPHEIMIRNHATGLNHIDWKSVDYNFCLPELPWVTGREMAGTVERVGSDVTNLKRGDRVWTSTVLLFVS